MKTSRPRDATDVRGDHYEVAIGLLPGIAEQHRRGIDVIHRDVEEALDLVGVQIDGQQPVHPRTREHVRHQLGGDRRARRPRAAVLARVTKVRHHRGDARRGGAPGRIHHHQQLHEAVIRRRAGRLHDEHIASAHVLHQLNVDLTVAEASDGCAPERYLQAARNVLRQRRSGIARKQRQCVAGTHKPVRCARSLPPASAGELAGVEGFEPPNGGIKTRCLTTWRHPSPSADADNDAGAHLTAASGAPSALPDLLVHRRVAQAARDEAHPAVRHPRGEPLGLRRTVARQKHA